MCNKKKESVKQKLDEGIADHINEYTQVLNKQIAFYA